MMSRESSNPYQTIQTFVVREPFANVRSRAKRKATRIFREEIRMHENRLLAVAIVLAAPITLHSASLAPLHQNCSISVNDEGRGFRLQIDRGDCEGSRRCGSNFSNDTVSRLTGMTMADLGREGAKLTATLAAEPGTFTCSGTVRDAELDGESTFTPDEGFISRMERMGFSGFDSEKLLAYALVGVESKWVESMQHTGVQGMTVDNLIALRIFKIDPEYIHGITSLGYEMPDADKLIALKVQGVNAEEVRQIRALGYQPTLDELIQIRIFKITPEFIHRMQDRGLKNLSIAKLVQIRIFKLDE